MAYVPAGQTTQTSSFAHYATVYYDRIALDRLTPEFRFFQVCEPKSIPLNSGKTVQFYRRNVPVYNTVTAAEGVTPAPYVGGTATLSATVEQYADFSSVSRLAVETDIANTIEGMVDDLSIREAGSVDTIIRQEIDSNTGAFTTDVIDTSGHKLQCNDFKKVVKLMEGKNIKPREGTKWVGVLHPYNAYDILTDTTAGAFIDSLKYQQGVKVLAGELGEVGGVRLMTSTNVGNDGVAAPNTKYYVYVFGKGGIAAVDLMGRGPDGVVDPQKERFRVNVVQGQEASIYDPTGEIAAIVSCRFVFAAKTLDTTNYRFTIMKADSTII